MTENANETNYYEIMYNLKLLKNESKQLKTIEDWEIFISKVLKYIFSNELLKKDFINRVDTYLNKTRNQNQFIQEYVNKLSSEDIFNIKHSYISILYFEIEDKYLNEEVIIKDYFNIHDLYCHTINNFFDLDLYSRYSTEIDNIECFSLAILNNNSLLFENTVKFSKIYLKALFNGVYNQLNAGIIKAIADTYYGKEYKLKQEKQKILDKLKSHKFCTQIVKVLKIILDKNITKATDLYNENIEATNTVKIRLNAFNKICTNQSKGEFSMTINLLKKYKITNTDLSSL